MRDVILYLPGGINGATIAESNQLRMLVSMMNPNQSVKLKVFRNGQTRDVTVQISEMPGEKVAKASTGEQAPDSSLEECITRFENSGRYRARGNSAFHTAFAGRGVKQDRPRNQASAADVKEGDVIQEVNRQPVANSDDLAHALKKSNGESLLLVNRGGNKVFLAV